MPPPPFIYECDRESFNYFLIEMLNCFYQNINDTNWARLETYLDDICKGFYEKNNDLSTSLIDYIFDPNGEGFVCSKLLATERELEIRKRPNYINIGGFLEGKPERPDTPIVYCIEDIPLREFTRNSAITNCIINNQPLWSTLTNNFLKYVEFCRLVHKVKSFKNNNKSKPAHFPMALNKKSENMFEEQQRLNYISRDMRDRLLSCITKRNKNLKLDIQYKVMDTMNEVLKKDLYKVVKCVGYDAAIMKDENLLCDKEARNALASTFAVSDNAGHFIKACDEFTQINNRNHTFLFDRVPSDAAIYHHTETNLLDFSFLL